MYKTTNNGKRILYLGLQDWLIYVPLKTEERL